ncbi:hypothetical protein B0H14DRAFT_2607900 [Mycena olivaceomarginata]|nr:hypothetical protein B0H14DRAFT_2607900 [Mycena olivaceomarginata]
MNNEFTEDKQYRCRKTIGNRSPAHGHLGNEEVPDAVLSSLTPSSMDMDFDSVSQRFLSSSVRFTLNPASTRVPDSPAWAVSSQNDVLPLQNDDARLQADSSPSPVDQGEVSLARSNVPDRAF